MKGSCACSREKRQLATSTANSVKATLTSTSTPTCSSEAVPEAGLASKPWVKTSLAPGSKVVTEYYDAAGQTQWFRPSS